MVNCNRTAEGHIPEDSNLCGYCCTSELFMVIVEGRILGCNIMTV